MKFKILIILFFVSYFFFSFDTALAIGIGVEPSFLDLELKVGQSKKTKILVYNISREAGIFQVFPDELQEWIKIEPDNFRLEAGEKKEAKITILPKKGGRKTTYLSVLAKPLDRKSFNVSSGIKIPLELNVIGGEPISLASIFRYISQDWIWVSGVLTVVLLGFFLLKHFKRQRFKKRMN